MPDQPNLSLAVRVVCLCLLAVAPRALAFDPAASLVEIEVSGLAYDETIPWITRSEQTRKNGVVIEGRRILTTADGLAGQYLTRIKKRGESRQYTARLEWADFYANVAVFEVEEPAFWEGLAAVPLADVVPQSGDLRVYRWSSGRIEERSGEIVRLFVGQSKTSYLRHLVLALSSEIESAGWAEIVVRDETLVGLTASVTSKTLFVLPAPFIADLLERKARAEDSPLGHFDFHWMPARNPALPASKGLDRRDEGVVVTEVGRRRLSDNTLRPGDIILSVDGFPIDSEGQYIDPDYGRLSMDGLATRRHAAGDRLPMRIWRDGAGQEVEYELPPADFSDSLIPEQRFESPPAYLMAGGLVFQPLTGPLLRSFGKNTPLLLEYYATRPPLEGRRGLVLLGRVLPDDYNRGYEGLAYVLVDRINGRTIHHLADVADAFEHAEDGFHRIEFMPDENVRHLVLDAEALPDATLRVLQSYRIPSASSY